MRRVAVESELEAALDAARSEAKYAFGNGRLLLERALTQARHVEVQVFADQHGNVVHLGERDCSVQRRHQKLIEESPSPAVDAGLRERMGSAAVTLVRAVNYAGAGTIEFLLDDAGQFYFMEMNTRLQVEHPVTEAITGLDLVEMQFRVAAGEKLALAQADVRINGHAVEARLYAEDPERGFLPSTGRLAALEFPSGEGIRVDTGVEAGSAVSPYYDPMIAKIIAHGADRTQALDRLAAALGDTIVVGPHANAAFLKALAQHPEFRAGHFDTGFIERHLAALTHVDAADEASVVAAAVDALLAASDDVAADTAWRDPWSAADGFVLGPPRQLGFDITVDGHPGKANVVWGREGRNVDVGGIMAAREAVRTVPIGAGVVAIGRGIQRLVALKSYETVDVDHLDGDGVIKAPMHGKVLAILVEQGARVTKGERVAVVEAMKMEHALLAPSDGTVADIAATVGAQVAEGATILVITPDEAAAAA
jgi:3-methylcrotonyl-CoA carboxylase alpha subunit